MKQPRLPEIGPGGVVLYSTWRGGVLDEHEANAQRDEAGKGHALEIAPHPWATAHQDSYTEVVSCQDVRGGGPLVGVRTVTPDGEELIGYPSRGAAFAGYQQTGV